jgi:hypothetical protein
MDGQRLADALAYEQERRRRLANVVPMPANGQPEVAPTPSLRSNLENLSSGLGQAGVNILEGTKALVTDPIGTAKGAYEGVREMVRDPSLIAEALRYSADKAMSGPLGFGEVAGELISPIRIKGPDVSMGVKATPTTPKVTYERREEGPFLRIRQVRADTSQPRQGAGVTEADGKKAQRTTEGRATRGRASVAVETPDAPSRVSGRRVTPLQVATEYTERELGEKYKLPKNPPSSLQKQAPIGRVFLEATKESPQYKTAAFKSYERAMPDILQKNRIKNYDDLLEKSYLQLAKEVKTQFDALPISMSYYRGAEGAYKSSKELFEDIDKRGHMFVYRGGDPHDFLGQIDPDTKLSYNEMFRAVHDYFGHATHRNQFGPIGEETAWAAHSAMLSPLARIAMSSETRGQNSLVNYSPLNAELKAQIFEFDNEIEAARRYGYDASDIKELQEARAALFNDFQYAPQKSVVLPAEMLSIDYMGQMPEGFGELIVPDPKTVTTLPLTHYSQSASLTQTDPSRYGTGIRGEEAARLRQAPDIRERTYFYTGRPGSVRPEAGLGSNVYTAQGQNLYNMARDPAKLGVLADVVNTTSPMSRINPGSIDDLQRANDFERLMQAYGYSGYFSPEAKVATVFEPMNVRLAKALRR